MALSKHPLVTATGTVRSVEALAASATGVHFANRVIIGTPSGGNLHVTAYPEALALEDATQLVGHEVSAEVQIGARPFARKDGSWGASLEAELSTIQILAAA